MGDFNLKVGKGHVEEIVGEHGLRSRHKHSDRLIQFCQTNNLIVTTTFFKLPPRRLYTRKSLADNTDHIVRNKNDFILIGERFRNSGC